MTVDSAGPPDADAAPAHPSLGEALPVWGRIAALSFGGPAGQIAVMHRILVDEKRWISENRFLHALNFCMLLPGPEAQQLATYVGWLLHGPRGGLVAGGLFILPGVVAIMALSWIYAAFGAVGPVAALFFGLKAAVLAIVLQAVQRIGSRALKSRMLAGIAAAAFLAIFAFTLPFPLIVLGAGAFGYACARAGMLGGTPGAGHGAPGSDGSRRRFLIDDDGSAAPEPARPSALRAAALAAALWVAPVALVLATLGSGSVYAQVALFFSKMAMVTFGGAYAALAYVAQQAAGTLGWLTPGEMLDGLGMAETTPGPLIMVLQFVGFMAAFRDPGALSPLVAGTLGGLLATWVTFAPCFLWIFLGAPYIEVLRGNRALAGALAAITAAVVGVILNLAVWFAVHAVFRATASFGWGPLRLELPVPASLDPWAALLALAAAAMIFVLRLGMLPTLAASSAAGLALHAAGLIG